jgi:hypothetical protein
MHSVSQTSVLSSRGKLTEQVLMTWTREMTFFHHRVAVLGGQLIDDCALINIYSEHHALGSGDKGVISLSSKSVHMITRRGLTQWHLTHDEMVDLRCTFGR